MYPTAETLRGQYTYVSLHCYTTVQHEHAVRIPLARSQLKTWDEMMQNLRTPVEILSMPEYGPVRSSL